MKPKKNIFITGAAGFIGFHLATYLHARGDNVIGYDNFNDYYDPKLKHDRANELAKMGVQIIKGDINDVPLLYQSINNHQTSHLVHLAAQAGVRYSLENPHAYIQSNIEGFLNILEICRQHPQIKLTYASSSSVYGLNQKTPFSVSDRTDHQASLYGVTKKTNELMAQSYHHLFDVSSTGLRYFTVYGPWGRPDMAYFLFTNAILENRPIQIYNNGQMLRDFTYIDDIIDGTVSAIDHEFSCEVFNLGHNQPNALMDLITHIENELGKKAIKEFLPMQAGDVISTYADIDLSISKLNFNPKVSLKEGINKFVNWYKAELGLEKAAAKPVEGKKEGN